MHVERDTTQAIPKAPQPERDESLAPKQARSRRTLELLLSAAERLLDEKGLAGTTVPAIARRAGVSVGVVYRRFSDKDALLRAVYERFFRTTTEQNRMQLARAAGIPLPLTSLVRSLIYGMVEGHRRRRGILRALLHYARTHQDADFRQAAEEMNRQAVGAISIVLLAHRDQIKHPDPEKAISFAILSLGATLRHVILEEEPLKFPVPDNLEEELVRMFLGYLGVDM
jgi:AcrR family transcriptional regulator